MVVLNWHNWLLLLLMLQHHAGDWLVKQRLGTRRAVHRKDGLLKLLLMLLGWSPGCTASGKHF
jgi:hypothetical protein